jgi:hypothetical protein
VDASITINQLSNLSKVEETVGKIVLTMRQWLWRRKRDRTNMPNIRQMPTPVGVCGHSPKKPYTQGIWTVLDVYVDASKPGGPHIAPRGSTIKIPEFAFLYVVECRGFLVGPSRPDRPVRQQCGPINSKFRNVNSHFRHPPEVPNSNSPAFFPASTAQGPKF